MTNVDRKIASSDTISVNVGHGLFSMTSIQMAEPRDMQIDEIHRPGETGHPIGDPQLKVRGASLLFRQDDWVVWESGRQLQLGHLRASGTAQVISFLSP